MNSQNPLDSLPQNEWDRLINRIVKSLLMFKNIDVTINEQELTQEAWVGLLKSTKTFDPSKEIKFSTFAYKHIRGHLLRYILTKVEKLIRHDQEDDGLMQSPDMGEDFINSFELNDIAESMLGVIKDEKHYDLFVDYFLEGKPVNELASTYGVSRQIINLRIAKLKELIRKRINYENA